MHSTPISDAAHTHTRAIASAILQLASVRIVAAIGIRCARVAHSAGTAGTIATTAVVEDTVSWRGKVLSGSSGTGACALECCGHTVQVAIGGVVALGERRASCALSHYAVLIRGGEELWIKRVPHRNTVKLTTSGREEGSLRVAIAEATPARREMHLMFYAKKIF